MIKPSVEQIIDIAVSVGLDLTADERNALPVHIQRQIDGFSVLSEVDTDGVRPLFEQCGDAADGGKL